MLSRVANSVYWMCRYIERAENIARFISVNLSLLLDMPSEAGRQWEPMIMTTGDHKEFEKRYDSYSRDNVIRFLTFDREYPNSIAVSLRAARENARTIREIISSEMWEQLNRSYLELNQWEKNGFAFRDPHTFFHALKMRGHMFTGLLYSTMSQNEAWHFARVGLMIERADKTSRILDVKYFMLLPKVEMVNSPYDAIQWAAVLKSTSALEMYRKQYHHITPKQVAEFLILDERFPRSIRHCIYAAQSSLHAITGSPIGKGRNSAEKVLGRLKADLEFSDIDDVIEYGMHEYLDRLQTRLNRIDDAVACSFFKPRELTQFQSQDDGGQSQSQSQNADECKITDM